VYQKIISVIILFCLAPHGRGRMVLHSGESDAKSHGHTRALKYLIELCPLAEQQKVAK
jgi:hypothetical protein